MKSGSSAIRETANRVLIVTNPNAGGARRTHKIHELIACLEAANLRVELVNQVESLEPLAANYHADGVLRVIVAAGGDGTVAEVANRTAPNVPITVLPLGTANLLAKYLRIRRSPAKLAKIICQGKTCHLDAGRANDRIFTLMVGCGFDADVVQRLHERRVGARINYWSYTRPVVESVWNYRYPALRVYCQQDPEGTWPTEPIVARWAFVVNLPCYAGGLKFAPRAMGHDGLLDVSTFQRGSLWHGLRYLPLVLARRPHWTADCQTLQATRVRIDSDEPVRYQLDGDPGGALPLDIEILPGRLTVMAPCGDTPS